MNKEQILARLKAIADEIVKEGADVEKFEAEARSLQSSLAAIEKREKIISVLNAGVITGTVIDKPLETKPQERSFEGMTKEEVIATPEYRSAFFKVIRGQKLTEVEERAMTTGTNSAGPAIPTTTLDLIMQRLYQTSVLLPMVKKTFVPGNLTVVVQGALVSADWHGEGTDATGKDENIVKVNFQGFELIRLVQVSKAALAMSVSAFETFIVDEIVKRMSVAIENSILNGAGSDQPTGILNGITWDTTNSCTFTKAGMKYADVIKFLALLPTLYHQNACICMNRKLFFNELINVQDNYGRPIFVQNPENPLSYKVLGYPVTIDDYMPDDTMTLCDPSYYQINFQQGIQVEKSLESSFGKNLVDYKATAILDGRVLLAEAFVKATRSAT